MSVPSITRKNRRTLMLICTNHWSWCVFTATKLIVLQTARNSLQFNFIRASLNIHRKKIFQMWIVCHEQICVLCHAPETVFFFFKKIIEINLRFIEIKFTGQFLVVRRLNTQSRLPSMSISYIWQKKPMRSYRKVHGTTTGPKAIHSLYTVQLR